MIGAEIEGSLDCLQSMHPSPSTRQNSSCENEANCVSEIATVKVRAEVSGQRANDESSSPQTSVSSTTLVSSPTTSSGPPTIVSPNSTTTCDSRIPRFSGTLSSTGLATTSTNWGLRRSSSLRMRTEESPIHQSPVSTVSSSLSVRQHYQHRRLHHHTQHSQQHYQHSEQRTLPVITDNGTDSPRQRSLSLSLTPVRPRKIHAATGGSSTALADDSDAESVKSYGSACSTASACDHAAIALNGTTWSGRSRKYVVHCSNHTADNEQYLTPTQRAARQVRKFQALLKEARKEIEEKDREILRLTKEVVELRLYKASLNSPDERTDSSDCLTVRENNPFSPESPSKDLPDETDLQKSSGDIEDGTVTVTSPDTPEKRLHPDLPSSLADSGHFEDGSVHSKDSILLSETNNEATKIIECSNRQLAADSSGNSYATLSVDSPNRDAERRALVDLYENRIENMHRRHVDELQELKQKHNDKVESLLNQLAEVSTRYCELRPSLDAAEARARELESELEAMKQEMEEQKTLFNDQEERHKQMYLKMYAKGQEAARIEQADKILECAHQNPPKVTVAELLQQLTVTQAELENIKAMYRRIVEAKSQHGALDPEITLQFLKSAIYYFLTDKENHQGHLNAIESILGFTEAEKHNIDKIHRPLRK